MSEQYGMDSAPPRVKGAWWQVPLASIGLSSALMATAAGVVYVWSHFTINISASEPEGIYQLTHQAVKPDAEVMLRFGLKHVVAVAGDLVEFAPDGIRVGGQLIPNSAPLAGWPHFPFSKEIVPKGEIVCLGDNPYSWDSRYVGPFAESLVYSTVKPLWVK